MDRLFKAKKKTSGEWVEGYLAKAKWYFDEKEMFVILPTDLCIYPHCEFSEWIEIDKTTICQYTGLTDKNGQKIWENDMLSDDDMFSVVRWDEEEARFVIDDYGTKGCLMEYGFDECMGEYGVVDTYGFGDFCSMKSFEVIGNVFDNPELLKGGE